MANAIRVYRSYLSLGNAIRVYGATVTATPTTGNAIRVYDLGVTASAPTANAGPDQASVEPGTTITLDGSASGVTGGGTIVSYGWSQLTGMAVVLSGTGAKRTFVAPGSLNGITATFRLTVTDSTGATATDDVAVRVLNSTEFERVAGVWVPRVSNRRIGGVWT